MRTPGDKAPPEVSVTSSFGGPCSAAHPTLRTKYSLQNRFISVTNIPAPRRKCKAWPTNSAHREALSYHTGLSMHPVPRLARVRHCHNHVIQRLRLMLRIKLVAVERTKRRKNRSPPYVGVKMK